MTNNYSINTNINTDNSTINNYNNVHNNDSNNDTMYCPCPCGPDKLHNVCIYIYICI